MVADEKVHLYYLTKDTKRLYRVMAAISLVATIGIPLLYFLWASGDLGRLPKNINIAMLFLPINAIIPLLSLRRINAPAVELGETYIKSGSKRLELSEIKRVFVRGDLVHLYTGSGFGKFFPPVHFSINGVENSTDLVERLKERLPGQDFGALETKEFSQAEILKGLRYPKPSKPLKYGNYTFTPDGIRMDKALVGWDSITRLTYPQGVITGYGAASFIYKAGDGSLKTENLKPKVSYAYLACLLYIAHYARNAEFDRSLAGAFNCPPAEAKADTAALVLGITGGVVGAVMAGFLSKYVMKENSAHLAAFAFIIPMLMIIAMAGLMQLHRSGKVVPAALRLAVGSLSPLSAVGVLVYFLITTPAAGHVMLAHYHLKMNSPEQAGAEFHRALEIAPASIDVHYETGLYYMDLEQYDKALEHFAAAYRGDPQYWGYELLRQLPRMCMKLGKKQEALEWCDRILLDHADKELFVQSFRKMKADIEKGAYIDRE